MALRVNARKKVWTMYKWLIAADSSCDLPETEPGGGAPLLKAPFVISVGGTDYVDGVALNTAELLDTMDSSREAGHTSCPSPGAWLRLFEQAEHVIAVTISSRLSGSWASAMTAREVFLEQNPDRHVLVIDSRSTGPAPSLIVLRARALIEAGLSFEDVSGELTDYAGSLKTVFALASFRNLVHSGRVPRAAGMIASALGIRGIGAGSEKGEIELCARVRGAKKALERIVEELRSRGYSGGELIISHCRNIEDAASLREMILRAWAGARVRILPARGLCSYYAERRGLIVAGRCGEVTA